GHQRRHRFHRDGEQGAHGSTVLVLRVPRPLGQVGGDVLLAPAHEQRAGSRFLLDVHGPKTGPATCTSRNPRATVAARTISACGTGGWKGSSITAASVQRP